LSKKKRFSKWVKPEKEEKIALIKEVYGYSDRQARNVADLLNLEDLKQLSRKGGQKR
jgi:flavorubredoxin